MISRPPLQDEKYREFYDLEKGIKFRLVKEVHEIVVQSLMGIQHQQLAMLSSNRDGSYDRSTR